MEGERGPRTRLRGLKCTSIQTISKRLWKKHLPCTLARASTCAKSKLDFSIPILTSKTSRSTLSWLRTMKKRRRMSWIIALLPSRHLNVFFPFLFLFSLLKWRRPCKGGINKINFLHIYFSSSSMCLFILMTSASINVMYLTR